MSAPSTSTATHTPPPSLMLAQMLTGYAVSQLVYVAATLGIPDLLKDGARSVEELAGATGAHVRSLRRLLRGLTVAGLLVETDSGRFSLSPAGTYLQTDVPGSMRALAICMQEAYRAWGDLLHNVRTGETAFDHVFGIGRFQYLSENPDAAVNFNQAMAGLAAQLSAAVAAAYDFSSFNTIVDVGGGHGMLMAALLNANPSLRGIIFDTLPVIAETKERIATGITNRCETVGGDFFDGVPEGGDAYILSHVIHNWNDEHAMRILRNCRRAIDVEGKLLLVEMLLPARLEPSPANYLPVMTDLQMLVMTGGCERNEAEYAELLSAAGFKLTNIIPTRVSEHIIEGVPV